jgi:Legionella pneumophila major outer membrane protein precursor
MNRISASALALLVLASAGGFAPAQDMPPTGTVPVLVESSPTSSNLTMPSCGFDMGNDDGCGCPNGHVLAGFGLYFIQPVFSTDPAYFVVGHPNGQTAANDIVQQVNFNHRLDAAPEAWIGYVGPSGYGVNVRYFQFAHGSSDQFTFQPPNSGVVDAFASASPQGQFIVNVDPLAGDHFSYFSTLNVTVWDFEATHTCTSGDWQVTGGIGIRWGEVSQSYDAYYAGAVATPTPRTGTLISGHNFDGLGPLLTLDVHRRFLDGSAGLFATGRGAILAGTSHFSANTVQSGGFTGDDDAVDYAAGSSYGGSQTDVLYVLDLDTGIEIGRETPLGRAMIQFGFAGQIWFDGSNAAYVNSGINPTGGKTNFGFIGMVLRGGLMF